MDGYESSIKGTAKKQWDILDCKDGEALRYLCMGGFVCAAVSKGKCRWRCQGWMIAVVFSAPWGGSDGCDGWLTVLPPSLALRLEIWAGIDSGGAGLLGGWVWACLALMKQTLSALWKRKTSLLIIPQLISTPSNHFYLIKYPWNVTANNVI